jgi:hypothetical protein
MNPSDIDVSALTYSAPKSNYSGGQTIFINNVDRRPMKIILPRCRLPFGISDYNGHRSLSFSLRASDPKLQPFIQFLNELDLRNVQTAVNNSHSWFNKKQITQSVIQELYNPSMKHKNEKYPPEFRAKFPTNEFGKFIGEIYDQSKYLTTQEAITKGCEVEAVVQLTGIYFVAKEFGVSWKVIQIKVYPNVPKLVEYSFLEDSDDDKSDAEPN